jgi:aminobenzoyl-glutamate utilization protein B
MSIGRKATVQAAHVLAATGLDLLTELDLLKAIRDEFDERRAGKEFKSLCDSKTNPQGNLSDPDIKHYECCIHAAMEHFGIKEHQK